MTPAAKPNQVFALIDCNNFFVSCERIFRPDLEGKPVIVLSSNDGCVVARSNESKKLGIPMGAPIFKYRDLVKAGKITQFSANFELYGDISKRITSLLVTITPRIEIYSVDESFLDLSSLDIRDYKEWGRAVREIIWKNVGVPVSIGIAPTKTLAKLASEVAKQHEEHGGVFSFTGLGQQETALTLAQTPVGDLWGVGRRLAPQLRAEGVGTAYALSQLSLRRAGQIMGVHGRRMVTELNGTPCLELTLEGAAAKSIMRGRTFGEDTGQQHVLESAIASLGARASFALRREGLLTRHIGVSTMTNRHKPGFKHWWFDLHLNQPTNDTGQIVSLLVNELAKHFEPRQMYHKLDVCLDDFVPEGSLQTDLLGEIKPELHDRNLARMRALDAINKKHGNGKLRYAAEDLANTWQPKHHIRSPRYVSHWSELPTAHLR